MGGCGRGAELGLGRLRQGGAVRRHLCSSQEFLSSILLWVAGQCHWVTLGLHTRHPPEDGWGCGEQDRLQALVSCKC
jgi:hypothetical protein